MLKAVLLNYACHGITLGPDINVIHGDWMGEAQQIIEKKYPGAMAMIAIGCAGDLHPVKRNKNKYLSLYAEEILNSLDKVIESEMQPILKPPVGKMKWVKLPFIKTPSVEELIELASNDKGIKGYYSRLALYKIQRGEELPKEIDYLIQVWDFGNKMFMVNLGGEVVVDFSLRLKKELSENRIWINAYSNDVSCYISSRRVMKVGWYEPNISMYWYNKPSPHVEEVEDIITEAVHELISTSSKIN